MNSVITISNVAVSSKYMYFRGVKNLVSRAKTDSTDLYTNNNWQTKSEVVVSGDDMYFTGMDDYIYRAKTDFTGLKTVGWGAKSEVFISGDYMYFRGYDDHIYRGKTDFTDLKQSPFMTKGRVFVYETYMYFRGTDDKLWKVPTTATSVKEGIHLGPHWTRSDPFVGPSSIPYGGIFVFFRGTDDRVLACWTDGSKYHHIEEAYSDSRVTATEKYVCFREKTSGAGMIIAGDGHDRRLARDLRPAWQGDERREEDDLRVFGDHVYYRGTTYSLRRVTLTLQQSTQTQQSPIELKREGSVRADDTVAPWLKIQWASNLQGTVVRMPDGGVKVVFNDPSSTITLAGKTFTLTQYHLHHKAEHRIEGEHRPIELHAVHVNKEDGTLAVLGVTFKVGPPGLALGPADRFFTDVMARLKSAGPADAMSIPLNPADPPLNPNDLLPADKSVYYRYEGSLTTPPYSENVSWIVLNDAKLLAQVTIDEYAENYGEHAREVQDLNRRVVLRNFP